MGSSTDQKRKDPKIVEVPERDSRQIIDLIAELERDLEETEGNVRQLP